MLDMGFIPDVERIVAHAAEAPPDPVLLRHHAAARSAGWRMRSCRTRRRSRSPARPRSRPPSPKAMVLVAEHDKREALRRLIRSEDVQNALIFCNRKRDVDILYKSLIRHKFIGRRACTATWRRPIRFATMEKFKAGEIRLLVCSDVAARGHRHRRAVARVQFRRPAPRRGLRPPDRPHRPRRAGGPRLHAREPRGPAGGGGDRAADRPRRSRACGIEGLDRWIGRPTTGAAGAVAARSAAKPAADKGRAPKAERADKPPRARPPRRDKVEAPAAEAAAAPLARGWADEPADAPVAAPRPRPVRAAPMRPATPAAAATPADAMPADATPAAGPSVAGTPGEAPPEFVPPPTATPARAHGRDRDRDRGRERERDRDRDRDRDRGGRQREEEPGRAVIGFGAEIPAFMLVARPHRPAPL